MGAFLGVYKKLKSMQVEVLNFEADSEVEITMKMAIFQVESDPLD